MYGADKVSGTAVPSRRRILCAATAAVGAAAAWPLIAQMNPDAAVRAAGDIVEVDLAGLAAGTWRVVRWRNRPIFVVARTPAMLAAMQEAAFVRRLIDPRSERRQQPAYAGNWHRSLDPAGRTYTGITPYNLPVPPHDIVARVRLRIGRNAGNVLFSLEMVEVI